MKKLALLLMLCLAPSLQAADQSAEDYMQNLGDRVVAILNNGELSQGQMRQSLRQLLEVNFALKAMGKFSLGKHWRHASQAQKDEFLDIFRLTVVRTYIDRFETQTEAEFQVTGSRREKDGSILVLSELLRPSRLPLQLDWRLYEKGGRFRVYDVRIDGISMSITQRSEYSAVIQREGGQIDKLNQAMRSKWSSRSAV